MRADASQVRSIAVVGDFNDWDPTRNLLADENNDDIWTITLKLEPGRYEYMFILMAKWVPDPSAYRYVSDGFGNKNAVLGNKQMQKMGKNSKLHDILSSMEWQESLGFRNNEKNL